MGKVTTDNSYIWRDMTCYEYENTQADIEDCNDRKFNLKIDESNNR